MPWLHDRLGADPELFNLSSLRTQLLNYAQDIGDLAGGLFQSIRESSTVVFSWIADLLLVPVVTFYLLRDWDVLVARVRELLPPY